MTYLSLLLIIKIAVTFLIVALPFFIFSKEKIDKIFGVKDGSLAVYRLYGVAVLALLFGYGGGLWQISQGAFPTGVIIMGIVSNGGATLVQMFTGSYKKSKLLTGFFAIVAIGLILALCLPDMAMSSVL